MAKLRNLKGQRFGRLLVIERVQNDIHGAVRWKCKCDCGKETIARTYHLIGGKVKSCGCLSKEVISNVNRTHYLSNTRIFKIWQRMKNRCLSATSPRYEYYGGRGIKVCDEWRDDFMTFYNWAMANGYKDNLTIDRIDNNSDYCPSNCRWSTWKVQNNNTRRNHYITYNGETLTLKQWSEKLGIKYTTLSMRINYYHWDIDKAFKKN